MQFSRLAGVSVALSCLVLSATVAAQTGSESIPDFSGVWQKSNRGMALIAEEPPMTAWGRERFDLAKPIHGPRTASATESNAAELSCLPMGFPATYFRPRPFEVIQLPDRMIMLFEVDHFWRIIYMDGREFPEVPLHTWNGYSIGHYEGDTLVIETRHMIGWTSESNQRWVDRYGHPFSDEIVVTERIRHIDADNLENQITIDDPVAYEEPWTGVMTYRRREFEVAEFICQELMLSDLPEMRPGQE